MTLKPLTGLLLIAVPIAFNVVFFMLQRAFDYPDILRQPTRLILERFRAGGAPLRRLWYAFTFSAVLFTPVPLLVWLAWGAKAPWYLTVGAAIGVLAGAAQFVGLIRWPFLVPTLAQIVFNDQASEAERGGAMVVFEAFHRYAGVAIGEHLGYLFTGAWSLTVCLAIIRTGLVSPVFGWLGIVPALGIWFGLLEEVGVKPAGAVNAISYILWSIWLIALGIVFIIH